MKRLLNHRPTSRSNLPFAIFAIVLVHTIFFAGLLVESRRRNQTPSASHATKSLVPENQKPAQAAPFYTSDSKAPVTTKAAIGEKGASQSASGLRPPPPATSPAALDQIKPYTVLKGDTLFKIARTNGVSVSAITRANPGMVPSRLRAGQTINIPAPGVEPAGRD